MSEPNQINISTLTFGEGPGWHIMTSAVNFTSALQKSEIHLCPQGRSGCLSAGPPCLEEEAADADNRDINIE